MRNMETGLGMSKIRYEQKNGEKKTTGEIQGKANVPQRSNLQKEHMMQAHNELSTGVELYAPDTKSKRMHHGMTFVDNKTGHIAGNSEDTNTTTNMSNCVKNAKVRKCGTINNQPLVYRA